MLREQCARPEGDFTHRAVQAIRALVWRPPPNQQRRGHIYGAEVPEA